MFASDTLGEFEKRFGRVKVAERFTEGGSDVSLPAALGFREIFVLNVQSQGLSDVKEDKRTVPHHQLRRD